MTCFSHVWLVSLVQLIITYSTIGLEGLESIVRQRCASLISPWWIPSVCVCVYRGTATFWVITVQTNWAPGRNRESCFLGLIDSLDVLRVWSISVRAQFSTSVCVIRLPQASFRKYWQLISDSAQAVIGKVKKNKTEIVLWVSINGPWSFWMLNIFMHKVVCGWQTWSCSLSWPFRHNFSEQLPGNPLFLCASWDT